MSIKKNDVSILLKEVAVQQKHQKEIQKIKGETFNIFSVLGVELKENKTHSNFIAELLNPIGSHCMGSVFLKEFLKIINYKGNLDVSTAAVKKEFHIAKRDKITGGRIDILINDKNNNYLSIENKIYAGDQENQLIRYYNYKKGNNTLYYLSLDGSIASEASTVYKKDDKVLVSLQANKDYYVISYAQHILEWLQSCHKLSINVPQLRDSIKQYILLIKKLTNQMIGSDNLEIKKALFKNAEAAQYISNNFQNIKNEIKEQFRKDVVVKLNEKLDSNLFNLAYPNKVSNKAIAQIFVELKKLKHTHFQFLIESFSGYGHHNGDIFIGILDHSGEQNTFPIQGEIEGFETKWWKNIKFILINKERVNLEDNTFLNYLIDPQSDKYQTIVNHFAEQCFVFINKNYPLIENYFEQ